MKDLGPSHLGSALGTGGSACSIVILDVHTIERTSDSSRSDRTLCVPPVAVKQRCVRISARTRQKQLVLPDGGGCVRDVDPVTALARSPWQWRDTIQGIGRSGEGSVADLEEEDRGKCHLTLRHNNLGQPRKNLCAY